MPLGRMLQKREKRKIFRPKDKKVKSALYLDKRKIGENTEPPILISEELLAEMKKMSPQDLMKALINPEEEEEEQEEYELTDSAEIQDFFDWSHSPEPVYEKAIPTLGLIEQMRTMSKEQVRYIIERSLAF